MWVDDLKDLKRAAVAFDREEAEALCSAMVGRLDAGASPPPEDVSKEVLKVLRGKRWFGPMARVAEALVGAGQGSAGVRRQLGQALIEGRRFDEALDVLEALARDTAGTDPSENAEARGLIGRLFKQRYVDGGNGDAGERDLQLRRAIEAYHGVWVQNPALHNYQGINAAACARRAERDGVAVPDGVDAAVIAVRVLGNLSAVPKDNLAAWGLATGAEACLVLDRGLDAVLEWLKPYVARADADAFEFGSTLRQLREVWRIDDDDPLGPAVAVLRVALTQREGFRADLEIGDLHAAATVVDRRRDELEKVFGEAGPVALRWYREGLERARGVGRIEDPRGRGIGTGFLVRGGDLFPGSWGLGDEEVLVTNAHVLSATEPGALRPGEALVRFEALEEQPIEVPVGELLWESRVGELDVSIARLGRAVTAHAPYPLAAEDEPAFTPGGRRRLYVIGHPLGGDLSLSLEDNFQVGWGFPFLHYRTPTEPGSSGSPVFDDRWSLVAVHHKGSERLPRLDGGPGTYRANEGTWIHAVRRALATAPARTVSPLSGAPPIAARQGFFVAYSHRDKKWLEDLEVTMRPVLRGGQAADLWSDKRIPPGARWEREIEKAIGAARIAVLLVSRQFLASDFAQQQEVPRILEANRRRGMKVLWIPVSHTSPEFRKELEALQALHDPDSPLDSLPKPKREQAWGRIGEELLKAVNREPVTSPA